MGEVPLFIMAMNRPVRSRMQGGVGRAGEKLALTRLFKVQAFSALKQHVDFAIKFCAYQNLFFQIESLA